MNAIRELFSHCSHQEQLALLEELPKFLCRDFIAQLPVEIVSMILNYLEPVHAISSCMLVSSSWRNVIGECEWYWRVQYHKLHKTRDDTSDQSFKEAIIRALKFERSLQKMCVNADQGGPLVVSREPVQGVPVGTSKQWFYARTSEKSVLIHQFHLCTLAPPAQYYIIEDDNILADERAIVWSWSTRYGALFYTHHGCWLFVFYPNVSVYDCAESYGPPLAVRVWQDEIFSPAHVVFGGCPTCRLTVRVTKHINDGGMWTLDVVKLLDTTVDVAAVKALSFHFLPDAQLQTSCLFSMLSVHLYPVSGSRKSSGKLFCDKHLAFFQIGTAIVINQLSCSEEDEVELSGPLKHFWSDFNHIDPSNFVLSEDCSVLVFMPNHQVVCVWDLKEDVPYTHQLSPALPVSHSFVLSVGRLYTMVGFVKHGPKSTIEVHTLSTTTGRTVFEAHTKLGCHTSVTKALTTVCLDQLVSSASYSPLSRHGFVCGFLSSGVSCNHTTWLYVSLPCC